MQTWVDYGQRDRARAFILDGNKWPLLVLPLKRRSKMAAWPEVGFLKMPPRQGAKVTVFLGNIHGASEPRETIIYADVDALLDDGWTVD